ncbi:MAG: Arm DNA-binding domain-containing protein [Steroidobacteraceae bacterium]
MLVTPTAGRLWRFRYRLSGVEKLLALGAYPDVTLKRAREKRDHARRLVADGVDPGVKRQAERAVTDRVVPGGVILRHDLAATKPPVRTLPTLGMRSLGSERQRSYVRFAPVGSSACKSPMCALQ